MMDTKKTLICLLCIAMISQSTLTVAAPAVKIQDVQMQKNGYFMGQVVDTQGVGKANVPVTVLQQGKVISEQKTGPNGVFYSQLPRGGVTQVTINGQHQLYRVWTDQTAPKNAADGVMIVMDGNVVRGQMFGNQILSTALPIAAVAGIVTAVAVAASNNSSPSSP